MYVDLTHSDDDETAKQHLTAVHRPTSPPVYILDASSPEAAARLRNGRPNKRRRHGISSLGGDLLPAPAPPERSAGFVGLSRRKHVLSELGAGAEQQKQSHNVVGDDSDRNLPVSTSQISAIGITATTPSPTLSNRHTAPTSSPIAHASTLRTSRSSPHATASTSAAPPSSRCQSSDRLLLPSTKYTQQHALVYPQPELSLQEAGTSSTVRDLRDFASAQTLKSLASPNYQEAAPQPPSSSSHSSRGAGAKYVIDLTSSSKDQQDSITPEAALAPSSGIAPISNRDAVASDLSPNQDEWVVLGNICGCVHVENPDALRASPATNNYVLVKLIRDMNNPNNALCRASINILILPQTGCKVYSNGAR
ncbi:hypothetical protein EV182_003284 [Spiromyces aspiralis]|uniref:Uncharacterized protein n=1 Tax=Spiromyces aspiralis TaxID=68401 RepID=A0ACC1HQL9_9FUNG|nr:hypothetical protein EV182_003284 [Spiromyces aspiralis]